MADETNQGGCHPLGVVADGTVIIIELFEIRSRFFFFFVTPMLTCTRGVVGGPGAVGK